MALALRGTLNLLAKALGVGAITGDGLLRAGSTDMFILRANGTDAILRAGA